MSESLDDEASVLVKTKSTGFGYLCAIARQSCTTLVAAVLAPRSFESHRTEAPVLRQNVSDHILETEIIDQK